MEDDSVSIRRSGRRKIRPLKYWEFEVEEDFMVHADITYNISQLTRSCISDSHNATTLSRTKVPRHNSSHLMATKREAAKDSQISNRRKKETVKGDKLGSIRNKKGQDDSTSTSSSGEEQKRKVKSEKEEEFQRKRTKTSKQLGKS